MAAVEDCPASPGCCGTGADAGHFELSQGLVCLDSPDPQAWRGAISSKSSGTRLDRVLGMSTHVEVRRPAVARKEVRGTPLVQERLKQRRAACSASAGRPLGDAAVRSPYSISMPKTRRLTSLAASPSGQIPRRPLTLVSRTESISSRKIDRGAGLNLAAGLERRGLAHQQKSDSTLFLLLSVVVYRVEVSRASAIRKASEVVCAGIEHDDHDPRFTRSGSIGDGPSANVSTGVRGRHICGASTSPSSELRRRTHSAFASQ